MHKLEVLNIGHRRTVLRTCQAEDHVPFAGEEVCLQRCGCVAGREEGEPGIDVHAAAFQLLAVCMQDNDALIRVSLN